MAKAELKGKKTHFTCKLNLKIRKKLFKCYTWSVSVYGAETWTRRKADHKCLEKKWGRSVGPIV